MAGLKLLLLLCLVRCSLSRRQLLSPAAGPGDTVLGSGHCSPLRVHLALTSNPSEMRVSWATRVSGCDSRVHYGEQVVGNPRVLSGSDWLPTFDFIADYVEVDTYGPGDMCAKPALDDDFKPPHLHSTVLTDLTPGAMYEYQIGHHDPVRSFRAPPEVGPDASFSFVMYADMGESEHAAAKSPGASRTASRAADEVLEQDAELVLHVGDISYANGIHKIWDTFLEMVEPYASRAPYMIGIGNHEYDWRTGKEKHHAHPSDASGRERPYDPDWGNYGNDSGGECGIVVSKLFPMPGMVLGSTPTILSDDDVGGDATNSIHHANPPFWFSYDYGSVHFATISTEHDLSHGSHQYKWLAGDLRNVDRCNTPWVILLSHRPMYVVHPHKSNRVVGDHLRDFLEDLLEETEVDLVLSGHVHAYARTCNIFREECVREKWGGTTHITLGCGGRKLSDVNHGQPDWLEYAESEWGYGRARVDGARTLDFEFVHSESGRVADAVTLRNSRSAMRGCGWNSLAAAEQQGSERLAIADIVAADGLELGISGGQSTVLAGNVTDQGDAVRVETW